MAHSLVAQTFKYAVIRLSPDALKGEAINIGIAVFRDGRIETHIGRVLTRVRAISADFTQDLLDKTLFSLKSFSSMKLPDDEKYQALKSIGVIRLGELGSFESQDSGGEDYHANIRFLLSTFVSEGRQTRLPKLGSRKLITDIRRSFREQKLLASENDPEAINQHKIVPNWTLPQHAQRRTFQVDLAVKNGSLRVCEILDIDLEDGKELSSSFYKTAVILDEAKLHARAKEATLAFKARGPKKAIDEVLAVADSHATRLVDWDHLSDRKRFIQDWTNAALHH
ncbi:MAG: hypothetical protein CFE32_01390 [Alphaproteobacteria bacterium PA3]|nr:MAG: hypothetical protein CFE32_01390 [Alphaproteobacteria bacterium PA3]